MELDKGINMTCYSGGAYGSDYWWGEIGKEYGVTTKHYYLGRRSGMNAPYGNTEIVPEDATEGAIEVAKAAKYNWGYQYSKMKDVRLIRDWAQVKYSDAVFAIGEIIRVGQNVFPNKKGDTRIAVNECVAGGTGYACTMAILHNKPVYVFDQYMEKWYRYDFDFSEFIEISCAPKLTENFAGIGTRHINDAGINAIKEIYRSYFNS